MTEVRTDTGEQLGERAMRADELQKDLFGPDAPEDEFDDVAIAVLAVLAGGRVLGTNDIVVELKPRFRGQAVINAIRNLTEIGKLKETDPPGNGLVLA